MTMTSQLPQHVSDLLPAYLNRSLDEPQREYVRKHLLHCQACRVELAEWEEVQQTAQTVAQEQPLPSLAALEGIWEKIDALEAERTQRWRAPLHLWQVFIRQVPLIHKSVWVASFLVVLASCLIALFVPGSPADRANEAKWVLTLFLSVVTAVGAAFIFGSEHDEGFEVTLSTPTSIRLVMLARMVLVVGYNFLLSALASIIIATVQGGGPWEIMQLWLGPMLLLASISVSLSLLLGSTFGVLVSLIIEAIQALPLYFSSNSFLAQLAQSSFWQTNLPMLLLAAAFLVFAVYYAPRQPRLSM